MFAKLFTGAILIFIILMIVTGIAVVIQIFTQ